MNPALVRCRTHSVRRLGAAFVGLALAVGTAGALASPANADERGSAVTDKVKAAEASDACADHVGGLGDTNNDGISGVAVGVPDASVNGKSDAGAVDLSLASGARQRLTQTLQEGPTAGNEFGASVAVGAFIINGKCVGLAVGVPGALGGVGQVHFYMGTEDGLSETGAIYVQGFHNHGRFGTSMAVGEYGFYVGAPGVTVNKHKNAGAVYWYSWDTLGGYNQFRPREITEDTPGVPGTAEAGDEFGASLAATTAGVFVGSPGESVGTAAGAGSVTFISNGPPATTSAWTQDSKGVPGTAEAGDHFGASLGSPGGGRDTADVVVAGIPGEDVGSVKDAGSVQLFGFSGSGASVVPGAAYSQDSKGIPGAAEAGDEFGAAVTYGWQLGCGEVDNPAVGAPGEDVGSVKDAGSVTVIATQSGCSSTSFTDGTALGGAPQAGARFGASLSTRSSTYADDTDSEDVFDYLLIGVPGETVSGVDGAGTAISFRPDSGTGHPTDATRITDSAGPAAGEGYGGAGLSKSTS
jgi:hypothetical protein